MLLLIKIMDSERENKRRGHKGYGRRVVVPDSPYKDVMTVLGIPLKEIERNRLVNSTVVDGGRSVFVEYPEWWDDYRVCSTDSSHKRGLLRFVLDNVYPDNGHRRLETVYLESEDLGRIGPDKLSGLRAEKVAILPPASPLR